MFPIEFNRILVIIFGVFTLMLSFTRCKKDSETKLEEWGFHPSSHFPAPEYTFTNNELTYDRFKLGRKLFYDPILSSNNTISCASCHEQLHAFAGHNSAFSEGINGLIGNRNSPSIANSAWNKAFLWDGGVNHLELFPLAPITNPVEMNETMTSVIQKLNSNASYQSDFKQAYGTEVITDQLLFRALAQFSAMLISDDSKYDRVKRGEASFTIEEQAGYDLFKQNCATCHTEPLFTDNSYHNNGLDSVFSDKGRGKITELPSDMGKFKTPSLRNVELTYPYMHDGRFYTLDKVYDHYQLGIQKSTTLDPLLNDGISLSVAERQQISVFLKSLTDYTFLTNPFFSEPKK